MLAADDMAVHDEILSRAEANGDVRQPFITIRTYLPTRSFSSITIKTPKPKQVTFPLDLLRTIGAEDKEK